MALTRFNGNVVPFASESTTDNRTVFGDVVQADDIDSNLNADFKKGWEIVGLNDNPTKQDFNAMGYTLGALISYLYQMGIAEYNASQEYKLNAVCIGTDGTIYQSLVDANIGNALNDVSKWKNVTGSYVTLTGDQTIAGVKTFTSSPIVPTPTTGTQAANKAYADLKQNNLGFTPVQQGTGIGQLSNVVKIGWTGTRTKITIDVTDMGNIVMDNDIGVANSSLVKTALNATGTAPIYACRTWVNFNGIGTVAIRASGNVSSITDNGTGNYTVNFTTAMTDTNYSVATSAEDLNANTTVISAGIGNLTTTSIGIYISNTIGGAYDALIACASIFR